MRLYACSKAVWGVCVLFVSVSGLAQQTVTTKGGTTGYVPKFSGTTAVSNSLIFDTGTTVGIGVGATPNSSVKLDIGGGMIVRGNTTVSRTGNATASKAFPSYGFEFFSNAYNSSTKAVDNPYFSMQSEPTGNNTASPSATFNLLFSNNGAAAAETGFYINPNGTLHFASAQTFPIAAGPQGPQGPTGPQGPSGPAGIIALPYSGSVSDPEDSAFVITNMGAGGGSAIQGNGAPASSDASGGYGVIGTGGFATTASGANQGAGAGVYGSGGAAENGTSAGGQGGLFYGGSGQAGSEAGPGITAIGGDGDEYDQGGLGVYATHGQNATGAALFVGDVHVEGSLTKTAGSFKIDHPVDPAGKYLYHSFVESPDMMNIYNGNVATDGQGEAIVTMPAYFEALNRDFRYQLTIMGEQFAQARVASKISGNTFIIKTDKPNVEVSWQVTGVRQDAWANAHRIPNEVDKTEQERGHYIHPELYGHAGEPSISEMRHSRSKARSESK